MSSFAEIAAGELAFANGHAGRAEEAAAHFKNDKKLQAKILAKMQQGVAKIMETCRETVDNAWEYFVAADFDTMRALTTHADNWAEMDNLRDEEIWDKDLREDRERAKVWAAEGIIVAPAVFPALITATTTAVAAAAPIIRITSPTSDPNPDSPTLNAQAAFLVDAFVAVEEDEEEEGSAAVETAAAIVAPVVAALPIVVPAPVEPAPTVAAVVEGPKRGRKRKMIEELKSELVLDDAPRGKRARKATFKAEASAPPTASSASVAAGPATKKTRAGPYVAAEEAWIAGWLQQQKAGSKTPTYKPDWTQLTADFNRQFAGQTLAGGVGPRPERTKDSIYSNAHRVPAACAVLGAVVRGRSGNGGCYGKGEEKKTVGVKRARVENRPVARKSKAAEIVMAAIMGEKPGKKGGKGAKK
ncbi:hypothetical protein MMC17_007621 [Xylographa soralifera]|nr:hypothetical protein [Xylographa soralifera]